MSSGSRNYSVDNKVNKLIEADTLPLQVGTVAGGTYASNGQFGAGVALSSNMDPQTTSSKSVLSYQRFGSQVVVQGTVVLDKTAAADAATTEVVLLKRPVAAGFQRETYGGALPAPRESLRVEAEIVDDDGASLDADSIFAVRILENGRIALIARELGGIPQSDAAITPAVLSAGFASTGTRTIKFQASYLL